MNSDMSEVLINPICDICSVTNYLDYTAVKSKQNKLFYTFYYRSVEQS